VLVLILAARLTEAEEAREFADFAMKGVSSKTELEGLRVTLPTYQATTVRSLR